MNRIVLAIALAAIASSSGCTRHFVRPLDEVHVKSDTRTTNNPDGSVTTKGTTTTTTTTTADPSMGYPTNGGVIPGNSGGTITYPSGTTPGNVRSDVTNPGTKTGPKLGATANSRTKDGTASSNVPSAKTGTPVVDEGLPTATITGVHMDRPDGKKVPGYSYHEDGSLIYHPDRPTDDPLYDRQRFPVGHPDYKAPKKNVAPNPIPERAVPFRPEMTASWQKK